MALPDRLRRRRAVNPYLAIETVEDLVGTGALAGRPAAQAVREPHQGATARAS